MQPLLSFDELVEHMGPIKAMRALEAMETVLFEIQARERLSKSPADRMAEALSQIVENESSI